MFDPDRDTMDGHHGATASSPCPHYASMCVQCQQEQLIRGIAVNSQTVSQPMASSSLRPPMYGASSDYFHDSSAASFYTANSTHAHGWWMSSSVPRSVHDTSYGGGLSPPLYRYGSTTSDAAPFASSLLSCVDSASDDYEVVLDDGTRLKRPVSLSTIPYHAPLLSHVKLTENTPLLSEPRPSELDDSSDTDNEERETPSAWWQQWVAYLAWPGLSHKHKMVLKCSFAYAIGCLFTFVPSLNAMIGGSAVSSHVVATVTVFFNPAKSIGGMMEATGYGLLCGIVALMICVLSMMTTHYLAVERGLYLASCLVTLVVWIGLCTFVLSYIKARANLPSVNTGSALAFIILFSILVREGSTDQSEYDLSRIESTFTIVLTGAAITTAVCLLIWPMRSTKKLRRDMDATLLSIRVLLKLLVKTFLLDADLPEFTANKQLEQAIKSHRASFSALEVSLKEAKREFFGLDMWQHADDYDKAVASLQRLAHHINGLRSSCGIQFEVLHDMPSTPDCPDKRHDRQLSQKYKSHPTTTWNVRADHQRKKLEHELRLEHTLEQQSILLADDVPSTVDHGEGGQHTAVDSSTEERGDSDQHRHAEEGALNQCIRSLRGPMKSLAYTCKQTIIHIQSRFTGQVCNDTPSLATLKHNLTTALDVFETSEHKALLRLYRRKLQDTRQRQHQRSLSNLGVGALHSQLMKQFPAEDVFLVYFFVFCMVEFANELVLLVELTEALFEPDPYRKPRNASWWRSVGLFQSLCHGSRGPKGKNSETKRDTFVPNNHNTDNTLQTPAPTTPRRKMLLKLWNFLSWFRQHTVRYAAKSAMISVALAALAYIPSTSQFFRDYRMEWTLVTIVAGMTPTVGGTNLVAVLRVLATVLGCLLATLVCIVFTHRPYVLLAISWLFSILCFWIILNHKHGRFGQFALLAYNLVVLYSYNKRQSMPVEAVFELAWKRCTAVSFGVVVGLIVTAYIWPFEARTELRKGLSDLLLQLSWLYKQLLSVHSDTNYDKTNYNYSLLLEHMFDDMDPPPPKRLTPEERQRLQQRNTLLSTELQRVELNLQRSLVELRGLLVHAPNEPRLKGAFPVATYEAMLTSCQNILDKFLSMRIVVLKEVWVIQVRSAFMMQASKEWMDMAGNVLLHFYLLASALRLKTPLPPYLPPAEKAREMLMAKLQDILSRTTVLSGTADHALDDSSHMVCYASVVMMEGIIRELDTLGHLMRDLYGSLVPEDQWKRFFGLKT